MAAPRARDPVGLDQERIYELWRPIIRPQRRLTLERMHQDLADEWSRMLDGYLPRGERVAFEGLEFETFARLVEGDHGNSQTAVFTVEQTEISGFLLLSGDLARNLVDQRLGMETPAGGEPVSVFSRIEHAILREGLHLMCTGLGAAYARAGIGPLTVMRHSERLQDTLLFAPRDYVIVLRFRVGAAESPLRLLIAVASNLINAVRDSTVLSAGERGGSRRSRQAVASLPIGVALVLGQWTVPLSELSTLAPGDEIVLPDGEDAWLAAGGVRLCGARSMFDGRRTIVVLEPAAGPAGQAGESEVDQ